MTQHFTRNTVSASFHCPKCKKETMHRIDHDSGNGAGRKGPCLECIEKLRVEHAQREIDQRRAGGKQVSLFERIA